MKSLRVTRPNGYAARSRPFGSLLGGRLGPSSACRRGGPLWRSSLSLLRLQLLRRGCAPSGRRAGGLR